MTIPPFVGSHGDDWCVRPAQLGSPDRVNRHQMQWLIVPGPPLSCYLAFVPPMPDPLALSYYHMHPETWSIHVVLSGKGKHFVDDKAHDVGPGSVIYEGPGVRHSLYPDPGEHLTHIAIQHPAVGYTEKQWVISPEAGTTDRFGDLQAFIARFGSPVADDLVKKMASNQIFAGERWLKYVRKNK